MKVSGRWLIPLCEAYTAHTIMTPWKNHRLIKRVCKHEGCSWRQRQYCLGGMRHWQQPSLCSFVYAEAMNRGVELVYVSKQEILEGEK
jgi:hypothetical protein